MNAFIIENMVNDRIREIEADVRKNQSVKMVRSVKVDQSQRTIFIVKWIRTIQMVINSGYAYQKYICGR